MRTKTNDDDNQIAELKAMIQAEKEWAPSEQKLIYSGSFGLQAACSELAQGLIESRQNPEG
jgi:hypothetical protein